MRPRNPAASRRRESRTERFHLSPRGGGDAAGRGGPPASLVRPAPLRHSCAPSVIPAPPPSFLRRQESMRPRNPAASRRRESRTERFHLSPRGGEMPQAEGGLPPASCDRRPSVIPAPPPSFLRRQESMRPRNPAASRRRESRTERFHLSPRGGEMPQAEGGLPPASCDRRPSVIPAPLRHSCLRRNDGTSSSRASANT